MKKIEYTVTKVYPHSLGLSTVFRQPFATSHCKDPHGYALSFELTFGCHTLDKDNWVLDFGGLKNVKQFLIERFDHRTALARNDPLLLAFKGFYNKAGFTPPLVLDKVGCEGFAEYVAESVDILLREVINENKHRGLYLKSVSCHEHEGNSAKVQFV